MISSGAFKWRFAIVRKEVNGEIIFRLLRNPGLRSKGKKPRSSDSTNGSRETSHIASARFMRATHSFARSSPKVFSIASVTPAREALGSVNLLPLAK